MRISSRLAGSLAMLVSMGVFIAGDTASKLAFADVPVFQVVWLRALAASVFCTLIILALGQRAGLAHAFNPWALARGVCEVFANLGFTLAIVTLPIADVTAIAQTAPLLVLLGASLVWGEKIGPLRMVLIGLGVTGALLVAQPGSTAFSPYALLGFVVALSAAIRDLLSRKVPPHVPAPVVALSVLILLTLAGGIGMLVVDKPVVPSLGSGLLLVAAGALMVGGHVGIFVAYKLASARSVAPMMYSLTLWAVLSSILVFGEWPNLLAVIGIALIVTAGFLVIVLDQATTRSLRLAEGGETKDRST
jgi:drug/metabolite transporter (DMT)-like permease